MGITETRRCQDCDSPAVQDKSPVPGCEPEGCEEHAPAYGWVRCGCCCEWEAELDTVRGSLASYCSTECREKVEPYCEDGAPWGECAEPESACPGSWETSGLTLREYLRQQGRHPMEIARIVQGEGP